MKWKFATHKYASHKFASGRFAGLGADIVAVDGKGLNLSSITNQPLYRSGTVQARYTARANQPRYKVTK